MNADKVIVRDYDVYFQRPAGPERAGNPATLRWVPAGVDPDQCIPLCSADPEAGRGVGPVLNWNTHLAVFGQAGRMDI